MIIILIIGAFLRPLPFVIFAPNLLPDDGVGHIDQTEQEATQVGEVRDTPAGSL
jgi:hypothetical protein